ncbi:MAG: aspartate aminotransferase family protein [Spirochaetes bacterium]|nr:aspartate aminotransferase family protein [Spirochaetota bacterium]MBN2769712.1 aspartate aminotransferase family protein [Spirochaetota bacterium]
MNNLENVMKLDREYLFQNYGNRLPVEFVRGEDSFLFDSAGKKYIDFLSGISVVNLGYSNKHYTNTLHKQIDQIMHTSNWFFNSNQVQAAKQISDHSFKGRTLFVNSGTEANEAAIKLARKYGQSIDEDCYTILTFSSSFHGRTFGAMSATGNEKIRTGFGPVVPGFEYVPFNDKEAFEEAVKRGKVCAVMVEMIQGEGGIKVAGKDFIQHVYKIAKDNGILFIADEIQTGIGRTGKLFAFEHYDIIPDIITLAKGLANGLPVGAMHAKEELLNHLGAGTHGTTFGGNQLATAAVCAVFDIITEPSFLEHIHDMSKVVFDRLENIKKGVPLIKEIRGKGLHIGVELESDGMPFVKKALDAGLVINCTAQNVLRIMPPLIIDENTLIQGLDIFEKIVKQG